MKTMYEGLVAAEARKLAANGITTRRSCAIHQSWEGGLRGYEFARIKVFGAIQSVS